MRGSATKWIFGTDHAGSPRSVRWRSSSRPRAAARGDRARGVRRARLGVGREYGDTINAPVPRARRLARLRGRALHDGRRLRARGDERVRAPLREGPRLPRQLHGQLGPRASRPRSRTSRWSSGPWRTRSTRSTTRSSPAPARSRSPPSPGDDARGHRDRREPGRRALLAADRRGRDPAAGGPPAADHRRRVRGPRVRHRARSRSRPATTPPTSRSAAGTGSRRSP